MNVFSLLLLIYFIYSSLGVFLFNGIENGEIIDKYTNFENFDSAMITLFRVSTGEDWNKVMFDCINHTNYAVGVIFFISFISITSFIMLNMFIMVILQNYEDYENEP
jgi:hypothetical protein